MPELIFIVLIILLLFGGKKVPELMRGLGKGMKSFKEGMNEPSSTSSTSPEDLNKDNKEASDSQEEK